MSNKKFIIPLKIIFFEYFKVGKVYFFQIVSLQLHKTFPNPDAFEQLY